MTLYFPVFIFFLIVIFSTCLRGVSIYLEQAVYLPVGRTARRYFLRRSVARF